MSRITEEGSSHHEHKKRKDKGQLEKTDHDESHEKRKKKRQKTDKNGMSEAAKDTPKLAQAGKLESESNNLGTDSDERGRVTSAIVAKPDEASNGNVEVSKAELKSSRKAEKRELKRLKKLEKQNGSDAAAASVTTDQAENGKSGDTGYCPMESLTNLSSEKIKSFLSSNSVTVSDPNGQDFRPIVDFAFLPSKKENEEKIFGGFTSPTPIQASAWPYLLAGRDAVGIAETGSGKTLAFGLPCVRYVNSISAKQKKKRPVRALIVSPTRELALQIYEQLQKLIAHTDTTVTCIYGGVQKDDQRESLKTSNIIVATPGRLNDFVQEGSADLSSVGYLVLDEADRMLDKGFEEEVKKIIKQTPAPDCQTLMFTATWPTSIRELAASFMRDPVKITIGEPTSDLRANTRVTQKVEVVDPREKEYRLLQLLKEHQSGSKKNDKILVFCLYKKEATRIENFIRSKGYRVAGIHGDMNQAARTASLEAFKSGKVPLLVATDVAARGLDIPSVKLVLNVTFPLTAEDYVHRIGRTGRAGQSGLAITLFTEHDKAQSGALINVLKAANQEVPADLMKFGTTVKKKVHEQYGAFYREPEEGAKKATKITFD